MLESLFTADGIVQLLLNLPAVLWAITFHEFCHGYAAKKLGDPTAEAAGRLSLNPFDHLDPIGTLCLLLFHFGWAKPVPINTRYFKRPKRDITIVSLAGIAGNLLTAFVFARIIKFFPGFIVGKWAVREFIIIMIYVNLGLAAFNIIPIPPLDGSRVLYVMLPHNYMRYFFPLEKYGMIIILALLTLNVMDYIMSPIMRLFWKIILL